jgi:hypothetical protein
MDDFFESKFVTDLKKGTLPPMELTFETLSIIKLSAALLLAALVILYIGKRM